MIIAIVFLLFISSSLFFSQRVKISMLFSFSSVPMESFAQILLVYLLLEVTMVAPNSATKILYLQLNPHLNLFAFN